MLGEFPRSVVGFERVQRGARHHRRDDVRRPRGLDGLVAAPGSTSTTWPTPTSPTRRCSATSRFGVEPGRTVAVVGATASGKSTLTSLLTRLVDPDGGSGPGRRHRPARPRRGRAGPLVSAGAADRVPLRRHRPRQRHPRRRRPRRGGLGGPAHRPGRRLRRRAARRPRHPAGGARHHALRRPAPAALAGPGPGPAAAAADPRRRHLGGRPGGRGADPGAPARHRRRRRHHAARDRLPQGHDRAGRRGPLPRRRPDRRPRHPRRAARAQPRLRRPGQRLREQTAARGEPT